MRLRVWKILDIWSMTGPVSGSFIHWVLLRGFSSMSSNAAHTHNAKDIFNKKPGVYKTSLNITNFVCLFCDDTLSQCTFTPKKFWCVCLIVLASKQTLGQTIY